MLRSPSLGSLPGLINNYSRAWSLEMWRRACRARAFDLEVGRAVQEKRVTIPVYLGVGQEFIAAALSACDVMPLFAQHRAHSHFLSRGGSARALRDELLGRETGCSRGMGGSASIHDDGHGDVKYDANGRKYRVNNDHGKMFGHSGLMGDQGPIAVGYALASQCPTLCVLGDASAEEDYVQGAFGYAATKKIPVLFVVEDNDLSILTPTAVRRSWGVVEVAKAYGLMAVDIADDPWLIAHHAETMLGRLPALINVRTCRHLWHAGMGEDGPPEWDRRRMVTDALLGVLTESEIVGVFEAACVEMRELWSE